MPAYSVPTIPITVEGITLRVPQVTPPPPSPRVESIIQQMCHPDNWKLPTQPFSTDDLTTAYEVAAGLDYYLGGHEVTIGHGVIIVQSRGYYHYTGS